MGIEQRAVPTAFTQSNTAAVTSTNGWKPIISDALRAQTPEQCFNALSIDNQSAYDCYLYWNSNPNDYEYISRNDYFALEPDDRRVFRDVLIKAVSTDVPIAGLTVTFRYVPRRA